MVAVNAHRNGSTFHLFLVARNPRERIDKNQHDYCRKKTVLLSKRFDRRRFGSPRMHLRAGVSRLSSRISPPTTSASTACAAKGRCEPGPLDLRMTSAFSLSRTVGWGASVPKTGESWPSLDAPHDGFCGYGQYKQFRAPRVLDTRPCYRIGEFRPIYCERQLRRKLRRPGRS